MRFETQIQLKTFGDKLLSAVFLLSNSNSNNANKFERKLLMKIQDDEEDENVINDYEDANRFTESYENTEKRVQPTRPHAIFHPKKILVIFHRNSS